jgi:AP-4 complex subunit sigma-1
MIQFLLMVNKQGQTRIAQYYNEMTVKERTTLEGELIRKCISRNESLCSFIEYRGYKVIYRRYASLFFIIGVSIEEEVIAAPTQNEMAYL